MDDLRAVAVAGVVMVVAIYVAKWFNDPLRAIPTVGGSSFPGLSYLAARRYKRNGKAMLEEGYKKYPGALFKLALMDRWVVIFSGPKLVEEIRKHPEDEMSLTWAHEEYMWQSRYTLEPELMLDRYHIHALREKFTRKLPIVLPDILDEVAVALKEHLGTNTKEWTQTEAFSFVHTFTARATNRSFVGLPLCRNEEYLSRVAGFIHDIVDDAGAIRRIPKFIRPFIAPFIVKMKTTTDHVVTHLRPLVEERMKASAELDDEQKEALMPNDLLQVILDGAIPRGEGVAVIAQRLLMLNVAAFHTSAITITHVLYHVAEKPDLLQYLREEVQATTSEDGWTLNAIKNMWKLDSLLRETLRYHGITFTTLTRRAMKDITLSDGIRIPEGTLLQAATYPQHHDDAYFEDANTFDPFRFARKRGAAGEGVKHQASTTAPEYLPFGHGKVACPGRHFAAGELKGILAYIILHYDMKLGGDGVRPPDVEVPTALIPSPHDHIFFRKREGSV
ncbi:hypothetical protein V8D89_004888 [Ganoderma adspersum]